MLDACGFTASYFVGCTQKWQCLKTRNTADREFPTGHVSFFDLGLPV